jgi:hypothetical protein
MPLKNAEVQPICSNVRATGHTTRLVLTVAAAVGITYLFSYTPKTWNLTVYADKNNLADESTWTRRFGFRTLEDCRRAAETFIMVLNGKRASLPRDELAIAPLPDYECAYGCKPMFAGSAVHVCETTTR